jgi:predicted DNA-binding ribbon-helix-helix protein
VTREVTLHLDEFGQRAFERLTMHRKGSADAAVRTACLYYLADRDSGRPTWRAPRFAPEPPLGSPLHVQLDDATWDALAEEAREQAVTVEQLALHAVVYFLADLDSGRLAGLLEDALEEFE